MPRPLCLHAGEKTAQSVCKPISNAYASAYSGAPCQVRDMREGEEVWIAKPSLTNQALSVCIFDRVQLLRDALEAAPNLREWVLQR